MALTSLVLENGGDEDEFLLLCLMILLKIKEGKKNFNTIKSKFGENIAHIVLDCSDPKGDLKNVDDTKEKNLLVI